MTWNLADAQNQLGDVVTLALTEGPQTITRRDDRVVVMSAAKFAKLSGQPLDFKEYLLQGTGLDEIDLSRDQHPPRNLTL